MNEGRNSIVPTASAKKRGWRGEEKRKDLIYGRISNVSRN